MHSIMGSETEYGLVPTGHNTGVYSFVSRLWEFLERRRPLKRQNFLGKIANKFNWWAEDLLEGELVDAACAGPDVSRMLGVSGERLRNGSRFYVDGNHPEYSTPECRDPWELVAHERAGERIVWAAVQSIAEELGKEMNLLKRNADYRGHSYACHSNYLVSRRLFGFLAPYVGVYDDLPLNFLQGIWTSHLISMQIFAGAGRILPDLDWPECFTLSQRQHFIRHFSATGTTESRSIINTRDRPYADPKRFGRLHVICCDSNRADWSNVLKYGTSALLIGALEDFSPNGQNGYFFPIKAVADFSEVQSAESLIRTSAGTISVLELQRLLLNLVSRRYASQSRPEYSWAPRLISMWEEALDLLERKDERLYSFFDYFVKKRLFTESWARSQSVKKLMALEHSYHLVSPESLFDRLLRDGRIESAVSEGQIEKAITSPPGTRAKLRARLTCLFQGQGDMAWHAFSLLGEKECIDISMPNPASPFERLVERERRFWADRGLGKKPRKRKGVRNG